MSYYYYLYLHYQTQIPNFTYNWIITRIWRTSGLKRKKIYLCGNIFKKAIKSVWGKKINFLLHRNFICSIIDTMQSRLFRWACVYAFVCTRASVYVGVRFMHVPLHIYFFTIINRTRIPHKFPATSFEKPAVATAVIFVADWSPDESTATDSVSSNVQLLVNLPRPPILSHLPWMITNVLYHC